MKKKKRNATRGPRRSVGYTSTDSGNNIVRRILFLCNSKLPYVFVLLCCMIFAVQLGALEPEFRFQKAPTEIFSGENCSASGYGWAFAASGRMLLYLPHAPASRVLASFEGIGSASLVRLRFTEPMLNVTRLEINGQEICAPCSSNEYHIGNPIRGRMDVQVESQEAAWETPPPELFKSALFDQEKNTHAIAPLVLSFDGGWQAAQNSAMPSSFYGVDAPFHINRVSVLSEYLLSLRWPWSDYSFLSVLPAALLGLGLGISHQYAYKLYQILLFFVPVCLFYLFSRRLKEGGRAVFLFSSLLYLALPMRGYLTGGSADLFLYGMTAHTLATYLSLFFFYFAYEFAWRKEGDTAGGRKAFLLALVFSTLAIISNQRIVFSIAVMLAVLLAAALAAGKFRRTLLLVAACFFSAAWFVLPQLYLESFSYAARLGGIAPSTMLDSLLGFFQLGYLFLPLFFAAGAAAAYKSKELLFALLAFSAIASFLTATDPGLNAVVPGFDGLRLLPSFMLPVFLLSGFGARKLFLEGIKLSEKIRASLRQDRETFAISVAFALLFPLSFLFLSGVVMTWDQYKSEFSPLSAAAEYSSLSRAGALFPGERLLFVWRSEVSQYPVVDSMVERMPLSYFNSSSILAREMIKRGARVVVFGNEESMSGPANLSHKTKWVQYAELQSDPAFEELPSSGNLPIFVLKNASAHGEAWGEGVVVEKSLVEEDRASVVGKCELRSCNMSIWAYGIPKYAICTASFGNCDIRWDEENLLFSISKIPAGKFEVDVYASRSEIHYIALAITLLGLASCALLLGKT